MTSSENFGELAVASRLSWSKTSRALEGINLVTELHRKVLHTDKMPVPKHSITPETGASPAVHVTLCESSFFPVLYRSLRGSMLNYQTYRIALS